MRFVLVEMNLNAENRELLSQINALNLANTIMLLGAKGYSSSDECLGFAHITKRLW